MKNNNTLNTSLSPLGGQVGASGMALPLDVQGQPIDLQSMPTITRTLDNVSSLISEDARAEIGNISEEMRKYERQGLIAPTDGMVQIVNKFNGHIFAYRHEDDNGKKSVRFIQAYEDGTYSPEFIISQCDLITIAFGNNSQDAEMERERRKCLKRIRTEYFDKCNSMELTNILEVIITLAQILNELPLDSDRQDMSPAQLYAEVVDILKGHCPETFEFSRRGGYFMLSDLEIARIAHEMGMKERRLLEQLKRNHLLYLTESCRGYQVKVPTHKDENGKAIFEWCYCLLDLEYLSRKLDPDKRNTADELNPPLPDREV